MAVSGGRVCTLLEQIIVDGALCSKASCVILVEASRVAGERETNLRAGPRKKRSVRAA